MNQADAIEEILKESRTIAVVGLSPNPTRPSHSVASYLQAQGYIPVNPVVEEILGEKSYADLASGPEAVDVVDIFRGSEHVPAIVEAAIAKGVRAARRGLPMRKRRQERERQG